jgi:hypothetical protein
MSREKIRFQKSKEDEMQKWEYLEVDVAGDKQVLFPFKVNGQELRDWKKGPNWFTYRNQLGDDGWELVTITTSGGYSYGHIFKRPKP